MKVTNITARLYHVGNVSIAPGETKEIPEEFENAVDATVLVPVKAELIVPAFMKKDDVKPKATVVSEPDPELDA